MPDRIKSDLQAFHYIKENLLKQNGKSVSKSLTCQFRGYNSKERNLVDRVTRKIHDRKNQIQTISAYYNDPANMNAKCAVGFIIDDEYYDQELDNLGGLMGKNTPILDAIYFSNPNWHMTQDSLKMLMLLQVIHDNLDVETWEETFEKVEKLFYPNGQFAAKLYDLEVADLEQLTVFLDGLEEWMEYSYPSEDEENDPTF